MVKLEPGFKCHYLTVVKFLGGWRKEYECLCICGNTTIQREERLSVGKCKSCGCYRKSVAHNMGGSQTYRSWRCLRERCDNADNHNYKNYGARGITYDPRWSEFKEFLKDMGVRPNGKTLDRIDYNGNYCKDNCKWSTVLEQNNNKRDNIIIEYNGVRKNIMQWAEEKNVRWDLISDRLKRGWSPERILNTPGGLPFQRRKK